MRAQVAKILGEESPTETAPSSTLEGALSCSELPQWEDVRMGHALSERHIQIADSPAAAARRQPSLRLLFGTASEIWSLVGLPGPCPPQLLHISQPGGTILMGLKPSLPRMRPRPCLPLVPWVAIAFSALSSLWVTQMKDVRGKAGLVPVSPPGYLHLRLPAPRLGNMPRFPALFVSLS